MLQLAGINHFLKVRIYDICGSGDGINRATIVLNEIAPTKPLATIAEHNHYMRWRIRINPFEVNLSPLMATRTELLRLI